MTQKNRQEQLFSNEVQFLKAATFDGGQTVAGVVINRPTDGAPTITKIKIPSTGTTSTDMSEAELLGGIHVKSPVAAQNFQVPTGVEISAALVAVGITPAIGDSFDFVLINLGTTGDIVTIIVASGVTLVGFMGVHPAADGATLPTSSGIFRFQNTAANVWVGHRVG